MTTINTIKADDLNLRYVNATTSTYNWSGGFDESNHDVVYPNADSMDDIEMEGYLQDQGIDYEDIEDINELEELLNHTWYGHNDYQPTANFYIDIKDPHTEPQLLANKLNGTCLTVCIINDHDEGNRTVLALTGGGMDMTWDIVRAFMQLGSCPPVIYTHLPDVCESDNQQNQEVVKACNRTLEHLASQYNTILIRNQKVL